MPERCVICDDILLHVSPDRMSSSDGGWSGERMDICDGCWPNFAGAGPSPARRDPCARDMLEAYVDAAGPYTLSPRQAQAMSRLVARWRQEEEGTRDDAALD